MDTPMSSATISRLFPLVGQEFSDRNETAAATRGSEHSLGQTILALAQRRFSLLERLRGWGLDPAGKVGRMLWLRQQAVAAELDAQTHRANFFWREAHTQLRRLTAQPEIWSAVLATQPTVSAGIAPEELPVALAREVFLETHQALWRGLAQTLDVPPARHRSYAHLDYLREMIELAGLTQAQQRAALVLPTLKQIGAEQEVLHWKRAEKLSTDLLRRFPDLGSCQTQYANLIFVKAITRLKPEKSEAKVLRNAKGLLRAIKRLKELRRDYPHNLVILELIGQLHYLRAVKLATGQLLSTALGEAQAALTYDPNLTEAITLREKLEVMMQELRVSMSEAVVKESEEPKAKLSLKGLRQRREAARGFRLMDTFKNSDEARLIAEDVQVAQARQLWEELELGPLERIDLRPLALSQGLQAICEDPPAQAHELPARWQLVVATNSDFTELDGARICAYLQQRLFPTDEEAEAKPLPEHPLAPATSDSELPTLIPVAAPRRLRGEPFWYWLFSRQGAWLKLQCAVAVVLLLTAGTLALREYRHRQVRAEAYREIHLAKDRMDFPRMVEQAERFLTQSTFGADAREAEVKALYSEALVRWVANQTAPLEQTDLHAQRYRALVMGLSEGK